MYAAVYETVHGFGSIGFLADFVGDSVVIVDPVLGKTTVKAEQCFGVTFTESGYTLPGTSPALSPSVETPWFHEEQLAYAANREVIELRGRETGETFVSGYPHAWEYIQRWRELVAPDWRTIALIAIFARSSIRRKIEEAERLYRVFAPTLRDALLAGRTPTRKQMVRYKGLKGTRTASSTAAGLDDARSFEDIIQWSPWVAEEMRHSDDFSTAFRDKIAIEWLPWGLGMAKLSFTMSLAGRDASCLDTRMLEYFFGDDATARSQFERAVASRSGAKGARGVVRSAVQTYVALEKQLSRTPYFDADWPMPYARAQWMLWETLGRTAGTADHSALWEVIGDMAQEPAAAQRGLRLVKNASEEDIHRAARLLSMLPPEDAFEVLIEDGRLSDEDAFLAIQAAQVYLQDQA